MRNEGATFSRQMIGDIVRTLVKGTERKEFQSGAGVFQIDKTLVCFLKTHVTII
jgi:hypothetical protein